MLEEVEETLEAHPDTRLSGEGACRGFPASSARRELEDVQNQPPTLNRGTPGRPAFVVTKEQLETLLRLLFVQGSYPEIFFKLLETTTCDVLSQDSKF